MSKLPWHKYLKGQQSKNNQPLNPSASLSPAADYMKSGTELTAGLCIYLTTAEHGKNVTLHNPADDKQPPPKIHLDNSEYNHVL